MEPSGPSKGRSSSLDMMSMRESDLQRRRSETGDGRRRKKFLWERERAEREREERLRRLDGRGALQALSRIGSKA